MKEYDDMTVEERLHSILCNGRLTLVEMLRRQDRTIEAMAGEIRELQDQVAILKQDKGNGTARE